MTTFKKHYTICSAIDKIEPIEELIDQLDEMYFDGDLVKIEIDIEIKCDLFKRLEEIDKYEKGEK